MVTGVWIASGARGGGWLQPAWAGAYNKRRAISHKILGYDVQRGRVMQRLRRVMLVAFLLPAASHAQGIAADGIFRVEELPKGASVTLPQPAMTYIPPSARVRLTATDAPQSVKISAVHSAGGAASPMQVAIYDRNMARVKNVTIRPGMPFIYSFQSLYTIAVLPQVQSGLASDQHRIMIESNKPLEISR